MSVVAIVQARVGSTRFPNKVMQPIGGVPMIGVLLGRLARATRIDRIVVATSDDPKNGALADYVRGLGHEVYRGSEDDVLDRYYQSARAAGADVVVRLTGDCPLVDPDVVDSVIARFEGGALDYASNIDPPTFPDGLDTEVFTFTALELAWREAARPFDREHVTPFLRESPRFRRANVAVDRDRSAERWTVDEAVDLDVVRAVFERFAPRVDFSWQEVAALRDAEPQVFEANSHIARNEGAQVGAGQKLWKHAKTVIPGGSMLLSKRAEMFLPDRWPAYFSRAKGCRVWDLDGREFIDMSLMGIGTNILGYGDPEVDAAVHAVIDNGNMSTLNCPEEVYLADRLIELHPWAGMARFARSGGEANAIAVRIARAATGRDTVAFCGYHGWHDWYLAANLGDEKNLAGHLLPGLAPAGVPRDLRGSAVPFAYNRLDELEAIVREHKVAAIKMEVMRNMGPEPGFLEGVRRLASEHGAVLIFDECTSGFRQVLGGHHKVYGVDPDMAVFGKTLGNGYAITAVVGRTAIMQHAQETFISSTFWTERIGPAAAVKTLEVMARTKSYEQATATGRTIGVRWQELATRHGVRLQTSGLPALISFAIPGANALAYKTLITQEMLKKGFLATTAVYACTAHTPGIVDQYFEALDPIFGLIRECEDGRPVEGLLEGPVCHSGFRRLN